jgi:hypothetical protein
MKKPNKIVKRRSFLSFKRLLVVKNLQKLNFIESCIGY